MNKKEEWIRTQRTKYNVDKLGKLPHAGVMLYEAEKAFAHGLHYASIFCTHSAMGSYLMQRLPVEPKLTKKKKVIIDGIKEMLKTMKYLDTDLRSEILEFSRIRGNLEHPKDQMETTYAHWEHDTSGGSATLRMKDVKAIDDMFFNPEKTAQWGLELYYRMCGEIYEELMNRSTQK